MKAVRAYDARERILARRDRGQRLEIVTPEGVALGWVVATAGDRISAFLLDWLIMIVTTLAVLVAGYYGGGMGSDWFGAVVVIFMFLVLNFYFAFFEVRGRGQTPGKRRVGIRVIDRHGGELTAGAVLARNFMRHLELFVPLGVLAAPEALWPGQPGWARGIAVVWVLVIALLPLWNAQRLRPGDLVAGTIVVLSPRALLAEDVGARQGTGYAFSREQLGVYGIYELQVLEGVLRDFDEGKSKPEALEVVCDKIRRKIGYPPGPVDVVRFLRDFYAAQRAWLEQKMLFGRRREDKYGG